ncbi:MAG: outer membrane lipoprotein [uncultured Sulfurovum sp.]|uniref:Outer membrane lipoprotein n=1 Tax=uncultured Sulfurovum sp. TaxID=269237 RepID=A0A6S6U5M4_9BACT|nr:MAG: outer membrane lipoprotein [uncultured Sulfurovum sp.]
MIKYHTQKESIMKAFFFLLISTLLFANAPLPVDNVNIKKFSGLWYEVARTSNSYQEECVASSVEYKLQKDNTYKVFNRCFKNVIGGELIEYKGTAKPTKGESMSQIDMTYYYFFTKQYRVIHLEKDYSAAVVADEDLEQVWVMSRDPQLQKQKLSKILAKLGKSMNLKRLIYTPQDAKGRYK